MRLNWIFHFLFFAQQQPPPVRGYAPVNQGPLFDDDPGIMSEVETASTGFRRGNKQRSSLPVVRTPSKTLERPLGMHSPKRIYQVHFIETFSILIVILFVEKKIVIFRCRFGILAIPIRNEESFVTQRNHVNWHRTSAVCSIFSTAANHGLFGRTKRQNLHSRCQQRYVLRIGGCEVHMG